MGTPAGLMPQNIASKQLNPEPAIHLKTPDAVNPIKPEPAAPVHLKPLAAPDTGPAKMANPLSVKLRPLGPVVPN